MSCENLYNWIDTSSYEWSDLPYIQWGECAPGTVLYQVWMDDIYAYAVTTSGLVITDLETSNKVSYIDIYEGFSTIWGNTDTIFLGTSSNGLKYIEKTTISGNASNPYDLEEYLTDYGYFYNTTSNEIRYIHGYEDTLAVVTAVGLDILNNGPNDYKSTTTSGYIAKCFMTSKGEVYYITQEDVNNGVFKMNTSKCDWTVPDISYKSGNSFLPADNAIMDIFVTTGTSADTIDNTLFVATASGVYVYDEGTTEHDFYYTT